MESFNLRTFPNPFSEEITFEFYLHQPTKVKLNIYAVDGTCVATLTDTDYRYGKYQIRWNTKDSYIKEINSGFYFYQLTIGENIFTGKLIYN